VPGEQRDYISLPYYSRAWISAGQNLGERGDVRGDAVELLRSAW
jgi:hypothetical protein